MLRQQADLAPVPWEAARDADLLIDEDDLDEAVRRLADDLVEPLVRSDGWIARWFVRGFRGARFEAVAGVEAWLDAPMPSDFGPHAWDLRERIGWAGHTIAVPPLELQLAASRRRELDERVRRIEEYLGTSP